MTISIVNLECCQIDFLLDVFSAYNLRSFPLLTLGVSVNYEVSEKDMVCAEHAKNLHIEVTRKSI